MGFFKQNMEYFPSLYALRIKFLYGVVPSIVVETALAQYLDIYFSQ